MTGTMLTATTLRPEFDMSVRSVMRGMIAAVAAAVAIAALPASASAQGLFEGFWGGGEEWGGKRQTVTFSKQYNPGQIIVSFGDRRLYHVTKPGMAVSYPIAVPREKSRWSGVTSVSQKRENPDWTPTPEMFRENPRLPPWVPGGHPMNPLGNRALYLGASTYRIHGTDAPWTIGQAVSKGCIRMFNEDVQQLYPQVKVGTKVTVTWQRFNATGAIAGTDVPPAPEKSASSSSEPSGDDGQPKLKWKKKAKAETGDETATETASSDATSEDAEKPKLKQSKSSDDDSIETAASADDRGDTPKKKTKTADASGFAGSSDKAEKKAAEKSDVSSASENQNSGSSKRYFIDYKDAAAAAAAAAADKSSSATP